MIRPLAIGGALVLAQLGLTSAASAEVVSQSDAGFEVKGEATSAAAVPAVWAALLAPAKWWNPEHTYSGDAANLYLDAQATGCFCELLPLPKDAPEGTRRGSVEHLRVVYIVPGKAIRLSGALGPLQREALTGTLAITLTAQDKGTRIAWSYIVGGYMRLKGAEIAPQVDTMLGEQFTRLAALEGSVDKTGESP